jgi:two-component sensor histidine kinase
MAGYGALSKLRHINAFSRQCPYFVIPVRRESQLVSTMQHAIYSKAVYSDGAFRRRCTPVSGVRIEQRREPMASSDKIVRLNPDAHNDVERQRKMLLLERQHRIKTLLLHVRAIAETTYEASNDLERFYELFEARLQCINRVHILMEPTDGPISLRELLSEELLAHAMHMERFVEVSGPEILIEQRVAPAIALAFHELLVNAIEVGTSAKGTGHIVVRWRIQLRNDEDYLILEWSEDRLALEHSIRTDGFGPGLVQRMLPRIIGGSSRVEPVHDGLRCVLEIPLRDVMRRASEMPIPILPTRTS